MSSVATPTERHIHLFNQWIQTHTVRAVSGKSFVLTEQLKLWLNSRIDGLGTKNVLASLFDTVVVSKLSKNQTIPPLKANSVLVFCILLELGLGHLLTSFTSNGISDASLPIKEQDLRSLSWNLGVGETKLTVDFFEMQWRFCPAMFELDGCDEWPPGTIVPICRQNLIAQGRTANVYEVAIPEDFIGKRLRHIFLASRYKDPEISASWVSQMLPSSPAAAQTNLIAQVVLSIRTEDI